MILNDYHVHSSFSSDSKTPLEEILTKAVSLGFERLCITDHMDREYPSAEFPFELELTDYAEAVLSLKEKYKGRIKLLFGIELGLRNEPASKERIKIFYDNMLNEYDFDFIIGSTHVLYNDDPYFKPFWINRNWKQVLLDNFQSIIDNVKYYKHFQIYGHLDYVARYIPEGIKDYNYKDYADIIDEALKELISHGTGIELNTAAIRYGLPYPHPKLEVLNRYRELGGEIITIGSDAHKVEDLAYAFDKAEEILLSLGFKYYTVFEHQNPIFIKL